ncbi:hypothetical protein LGV61_03740 [Desulfurispirillum indicum]|uniref:hypothetical protein n=1 Tax=Desulfurispirillum indicum TaxID=936456 RepID=UPI001CF9630D|nr:hypothetical protein [Desulfurispirillum indicum]UCZ57403.1 hypothetical protein LGV61_03740 [Desulfurispirillum indicum]
MDILPSLVRQLETLQQTHNVRLSPGEKLDILVRGMRSSHEVSLFLRGQEITARTETPLQPGRYQVLVQALQPALTLKILPQLPTVVPPSLSALPTPSLLSSHPLATLLQLPAVSPSLPLQLPGGQLIPEEASLLRGSRLSLEGLIRDLQAPGATAKPAVARSTAEQLQHLSVHSGMLMENHLLTGSRPVVQDLKFQLLLLAGRYANSERLVDTIRQRLQFLTREQVANLILNQDGIFLVEIPLDTADQLRRLRMRLQKRKKEARGIDSDILSLYMEFSRLGEIKVNCFQRDMGIDIVVFSNERKTVQSLEQSLEELRGAIEMVVRRPVRCAVHYREENLFQDFDENLVLIRAIKSWPSDDEEHQ